MHASSRVGAHGSVSQVRTVFAPALFLTCHPRLSLPTEWLPSRFENVHRSQEQIIADLASSREEEADACQTAQESLAKQRPALASSEGRVRELLLEVANLDYLVKEAARTKIEQQSSLVSPWDNHDVDGRRGREDCHDDHHAGGGDEGGCKNIPSTQRDDDDVDDVCRYDDGVSNIPKIQVRSRGCNHHYGMIDSRAEEESGSGTAEPGSAARRKRNSRETQERDRGRSVVLALEESLHAVREGAEHLKRRVATLRAALQEAQQRGHQMEAAASSARAVADTAGAAVAAATAEADKANAGRHEAERNTIAAERRQHENVEVLKAEVSTATAADFEAREKLAVALGEVSRLRRAIEVSDRRAAVLDGNLALATTSLHEAEAGRVRTLVGRVLLGGQGSWEMKQEGCHVDDCSGSYGAARDWPLGRMVLSDAAVGVRPRPTPLALDIEGISTMAKAAESAERSQRGLDDGSSYETSTLRDRLVASQAQHTELVLASQEAIARCNQRCEARVRALVAAGKLAVGCSWNRGVFAGRESTVEAANRLALVKRCFRALKEEALSRSRNRSIRRQDRMQRWIGEAFEQAEGEITRSRQYLQYVQRRHWGRGAGEGSAIGTPEGSVSSSPAGITAPVLRMES